MKRMLLSIAALAFVFGAVFTSCTKEDTTKPVISITGAATVAVSLNGTYTDAGATADDDTDGNLTTSITVTNPVNTNIAGTYTVTYSVTDAAGNTATASRTVTVANDEANRAGSYAVSGNFAGAPDTFYTTETVAASSTVNNRILFAKFVAYEDANAYANITGTTLSIPSQTYVCGTDQVSRTFVGTGAIVSATSFTIAGSVTDGTNTYNWDYTFTLN